MVRRYELADDEFTLLADLLPPTGKPGGQWNDHRTTLDGILWILHTGAQWRELPERYGKWKSVYDRFRRWARDGTIGRILERLQLRLDASGRIDFDLWCIDGTSIRASRAAAGAGGKKGRGRAGRPCPRPLARRLRDQVASGRRLQGRPPLGGRHGGPSPRVEVGGDGPGVGADQATRPGPPASSTKAVGRRQGVQLPEGSPLPASSRDQGGDPDPQGSAAEPALRQGGVSTSQHYRALHPLAEGESTPGDPVREARDQLLGDGQAGHDPSMFAYA
jgi:transposase